MKLRNPTLIRWIAFLGAIFLRLYFSTLRIRYRPLGLNHDPSSDKMKCQYIYVFWHESILMPCYQFANCNVHVLISEHADGELVAQVCHYMGYRTVRGSSTRGGVQALKKMMRALARDHVVVVPDGPRGPRRQVGLGMIYLASRTGLPIVAFAIAYNNYWRLRTWDQFAVPKPFSLGVITSGNPIYVPPKLDKAGLEEYRLKVERSFAETTEHAERLAGNRPDVSDPTEVTVRRAA